MDYKYLLKKNGLKVGLRAHPQNQVCYFIIAEFQIRKDLQLNYANITLERTMLLKNCRWQCKWSIPSRFLDGRYYKVPSSIHPSSSFALERI